MQGCSLAILDVGHGNSAALIDSTRVVVIDTGLGDSVRHYLMEQGVTTINVVLISHADADHIGGLVHLLACNQFTIQRVRLNSDAAKDSSVWEDLRYELDRAHNANELDFDVSLVRDNSGEFDQGEVTIEVLGPSRYLASGGPGSRDHDGRRVTTNSISAVIRLSVGDAPLAVLPGDLDLVGLDDLVRAGVDAKAPVLVFPHHGGRPATDSAASFVKRVCETFCPSTVVFSIGRGLHDTPRPEVVAAIREHLPGARIMCTQLSKHCADSVPKTEPGHLIDVFAEGRERRSCCAGTMLLDLGATVEVSPSETNHRSFIEQHAPSALCQAH